MSPIQRVKTLNGDSKTSQFTKELSRIQYITFWNKKILKIFFKILDFEISKSHILNHSPKAKKSIFLNFRVPENFFEMF